MFCWDVVITVYTEDAQRSCVNLWMLPVNSVILYPYEWIQYSFKLYQTHCQVILSVSVSKKNEITRPINDDKLIQNTFLRFILGTSALHTCYKWIHQNTFHRTFKNILEPNYQFNLTFNKENWLEVFNNIYNCILLSVFEQKSEREHTPFQ